MDVLFGIFVEKISKSIVAFKRKLSTVICEAFDLGMH